MQQDIVRLLFGMVAGHIDTEAVFLCDGCGTSFPASHESLIRLS